jgi:hypothetical protein
MLIDVLSFMEYKKEAERQRERARIASESVYGFWLNEDGSTMLKIAPTQYGARIKLINADKDFLSLISKFCGLRATPKRSNWKGFNLVDHLKRINYGLLDSGVVNLPRAERQNYAAITSITKKVIKLYVYHFEMIDRIEHAVPEGSFNFNKIVSSGTHILNKAELAISI